jgi:type I restriction enzyme S subunit
MKNGWKTETFEKCIEKVTYTQKIQRKDFLDSGAYPVVSQEEDLINGYWDNEADVYKVATPIVVFGDHTKVLKYVDFDFVLGADGVKVLLPREFLLPKFFFYQLQTANLDSLGYARHYKLLKDLEIGYPPFPDQRRVVGILDKAFAGIATAKANAERNLQNARALFESHLQAVFTQRGEGWVDKPLGEIADFKNGLNFSEHSSGQSVRVVGVGDFQCNSIVPADDLGSVTIDGDLGENYAIRKNDILTVRSNGSKDLVGRCMLVPEVRGVVSYSGFIIRIRFDTNAIDPKFLLHFMKCSATRERLTRHGGGANISNINQEKLSSLSVPLPSLTTQQRQAEKLDQLQVETQRLESLYQRKLAALDELKKSLLHRAFGGEL